MPVSEIVNSEDIEFGDSSWYLDEMFKDGGIQTEDYEFYTSRAGNPFAKDLVLDIKFSECEPEFIESIRESGIRRPVTIVDNTVIDGHHRLAVARHLGIEALVKVFDNWEEWHYSPENNCPLPGFDGSTYV